MYQPPQRPRSTMAGQAEVGTDAAGWTSPMPQVALGRADPQANCSEGGLDHAGVGLMRHRVVPPTQFDGRMPEDPFRPELVNVDEVCNGGAVDYFTNLLVNDQESHDLPPPSHTTNNDVPAAAKGSQKRTKNFRDEEDKLLVSAWLNIGMDPIQGSDQPLGTYWTRIHQYFHANKTFESDRTHGSLMNRWGGIQHDVNVFCGCVSRIEARNQSGCSVDDKIASACAMFKAEDSKNKKFAYMHCWKILKDKPKWAERRRQLATPKTASNKKQKTVVNSSPASAPTGSAANAEDTTNALGRPEGKKKEKQKLRQRSTIEAVDYLVDKMKEADVEKDLKKAERWDRAFALQEEKMKLDREKFEFQRELEEERILSLDLSTMTDKQREFYERRQTDILARRYGC